MNLIELLVVLELELMKTIMYLYQSFMLSLIEKDKELVENF